MFNREKLIKESAQLFIRRKQLIRELATCIYPITEVFFLLNCMKCERQQLKESENM